MIYGYIRVSTDTQTVKNQRFEISRYAKEHKISIDSYIEETVSGAKNYSKRRLEKLLAKLKKGDILIASELSRLGRSLYMIMDILHYCMVKEVKVITIKDNFFLSDNIESKVLAFAFALSAEIERKLISERTKEALARIKEEGKHLGRPFASKSVNKKLYPFKDEIFAELKKRASKASIAKRYNSHINSVYNFINKYKDEMQ